MRPFFSYYGAKYTVAKYAGPPRRHLVIEPFCGGAGYSTRYSVRHAKLYDISPDICALWDWLIHCSDADILAIPDYFESYDQVRSLHPNASLLVRFWVAKGRAEPSGTLSPWYFQYRNAQNCRVWGPAVKKRILVQKPFISEWKVDCRSYKDIKRESGHWHVDAPYDNHAGRRYPFSSIDYAHLAEWCRQLPGAADVFENEGAKWLPFQPLCEVVSTRGRRSGHVSKEVIWRSDDLIW